MIASKLPIRFCETLIPFLSSSAGHGGKDREAEGMSESDAVGPQVSFFYETIKAGFYMKLLKNGLCFNSVWGQSLNLSHSPPD